MDSLLHRVGAPPKQLQTAKGWTIMQIVQGHNANVPDSLSKETNPPSPRQLGATAFEDSKISQRQGEDNGSWGGPTALDVQSLCKER